MKIHSKLRMVSFSLLLAAFLTTCLIFARNIPASVASTVNSGRALEIAGILEASNATGTNLLPQINPNGISGLGLPHSQRYLRDASELSVPRGGALKPHVAGGPVIIDEAVQTFDTLAPPTTFLPPAATNSMSTQNIHPVWTGDGRYILFSSNRPSGIKADTAGTFHIWAIARDGEFDNNAASAIQLTSGKCNEYYPALDSSNNTLAFVSDANSSSTNLYTIHFNIAAGTPVDVTTLTSLTSSSNQVTGFTTVGRPTWSPSGDQIAFSALTNTGVNAGHYHIYFLYTASNGYRLPNQGFGPNPPGKLTDGLEDDTDPAWSPDARYIAFASTATGFTNTGKIIFPDPTNPTSETTPSVANGVSNPALRRVFILSSQGQVPPGVAASQGGVTSPGSDDYGPVWSQTTTTGQPFSGDIAFSRGTSRNAPHDIFYLNIIPDFNSSDIRIENQQWTVTFGNTPVTFTNTVNHLDTSDPGNTYDDMYPAWPPVSILVAGDTVIDFAYSSNRSVTYNDPVSGFPSETPINVSQGAQFDATHTLSADYVGLLESRTDQVNPPTLLRFDGDEIVHVNQGVTAILPGDTDKSGSAIRNGIPAGQTVTFTVRLSNREALNDDGRMFIQIKDPDSKYQDSDSREHKVLARSRPEAGRVDSGSASRFMYNYGLGNFFQLLTLKGVPTTVQFRGPIGGFDGTNMITVGRDGGGINQITTGNPPVLVTIPGGNPNNFISWGQEYECDVLNAKYPGNSPSDSDYLNPYFLAGFDDTGAHTGTFTGRNEWLKLSRLPDDHLGGVLYSASWQTPVSASDYYLDVIAFDHSNNWRIYDNVWGFSTQPFDGSKGILVVSDYALGQKFAASTFGNRGGANIRPSFYGSEMMLTDYDVNKLPNAVDIWKVPVPAITGVGDPVEQVDPIGYPFFYDDSLEMLPDYFNTHNGLGVFSYDDRLINPGFLPVAPSQEYSIWRTLARGPIPQNVLLSFAPHFESQPAVDLGDGSSAPADPHVANAPKCVIWSSPYTGDLFVGPGTLADPITQGLISTFVAAGGRLCITGQDIANTITTGGLSGNDPTGTGFLPTVLGATFSNTTTNHLLAGQITAGHRISYDALFNPDPAPSRPHLNFADIAIGPVITITYQAPAQKPNFQLANDLYNNTLGSPPITARTDASLSQLGPNAIGYGDGLVVNSLIDEIKPLPADHKDFAFGDGGFGLVYYENQTTGSRVVYSSFGLEGIGIEYQKRVDSVAPNRQYYLAYNERPNILHNIVCYLRTASFKGTIHDKTGLGGGTVVEGATVYLVPDAGVPLPANKRNVYSGTTDSFGLYQIDGVEPGAYQVVAFKDGYTRATTLKVGTVYVVEGDTTVTVDLDISAIPTGSIQGRVVSSVDNSGVPNALVSFTSVAGTKVTATTDANGNYSIPNVPAGAGAGISYTGTASKFGKTSAPHTISVVSGQNVTVPDFVLDPADGSITGTVIDAKTGNGVGGATVAFSTGTTIVATTVSAANTGAFTSPALPPGTYTVTATALGYASGKAANPVAVPSGANVSGIVVPLNPLIPGTLGGLVKDANGPITGATVTINDSSGVTVATLTTTAPSAGPDGTDLNYIQPSLAQGDYTVIATAPQYNTVTVLGTVPPGGFGRADVTLVQVPGIVTFPVNVPLLFSTPYDYSGQNFDILFGPANALSNGGRSKIFYWDPTQLQYLSEPNPPADSPHLGYGYWVKLRGQSFDLRVTGTLPSGDTVAVGLSPVWNMIGVPSLTKIPVSKLTFPNADPTQPNITFAQASSPEFHMVSPILYKYVADPTGATRGHYAQVIEQDVSAGDNRDTSLMPWQGYWIKAYTNTTVYIPTH